MLPAFHSLLLTVSLALLVNGRFCDNATLHLNETDTVELNESDYCFLNDCTIRMLGTNTSLNIINQTEEWITAINMTNFSVTAPANGVSCSLKEPAVVWFIIVTVVSAVTITSSTISSVLHLAIKDLHTVSGILIIEICVSVIITGTCQVLTAVFQYAHSVDGYPMVCAVLKYTVTASSLFYTLTKAIYLFHFAYLMFRTYRCRPHREKDKRLLYIYGTAILVVGTFCTALVIAIDLLNEKAAFDTYNGYCTSSFYNLHTSISNQVVLIIYILITILETVFFIFALTFYFLANKCSCMCNMTGPSDLRVSITLLSSLALGTVVLVALLLAGVTGESSVIVAGIVVFVEQTTLLIVFLTSKIVCTKLKCHKTRRGFIGNDMQNPLLTD